MTTLCTKPKVPHAPPPPSTPKSPDGGSFLGSVGDSLVGLDSFITTAATGLASPAKKKKKELIGG